MADDRFQTLPNGSVYDKKLKKIVKSKTEGKKTEVPKEDDIVVAEPPKSPKSAKKQTNNDISIIKNHTAITMEILEYNRNNKAQNTDPHWLYDRGMWYFQRCIDQGVTPTPQGLVLAFGFKASEQNMMLSGNNGLNAECREVILAFKQGLEAIAEGALVDSKSGQVGRIFDLKNRFGWTDQGNASTDEGRKFGEIKSPDELKKALAKMPGLDLIDEPKAIDVDFEVVE